MSNPIKIYFRKLFIINYSKILIHNNTYYSKFFIYVVTFSPVSITSYFSSIFYLAQFVPLVVDLCTQIVEARGLEMIGVYRIPGNKAAVTLLQDEFNKVSPHLKYDISD